MFSNQIKCHMQFITRKKELLLITYGYERN